VVPRRAAADQREDLGRVYAGAAAGRRSRRPRRGQRRLPAPEMPARPPRRTAARASSSPGSAGASPELDLGHDRRPIQRGTGLCAPALDPASAAPAATRRVDRARPQAALSGLHQLAHPSSPRAPSATARPPPCARPDGPRERCAGSIAAAAAALPPPPALPGTPAQGSGSASAGCAAQAVMRREQPGDTAPPCRAAGCEAARLPPIGRAELSLHRWGAAYAIRRQRRAIHRTAITAERAHPARSHIAPMLPRRRLRRERALRPAGLVQADDLDERHRRRVALRTGS